MSAPHAMALRHVARTPLTLAMAVLWAMAAMQLVLRLPDGALALKWPLGVALAALTSTLLLGMLRALALAAVPVLLGLVATLALSHQLGVDDPAGLGAVAAAYALAAWHAVTAALVHPTTGALAERLRLAGGHGTAGGCALVERAVHRAGFGVCLAVLALVPALFVTASLWDAWPWPPTVWPMLTLASAFFFLAGWRYRLRSHSYAFLVSALFASWLAQFVLAAPAAMPAQLITGAGFALWTTVFSLALSGAALAIERPAGAAGLERARALYLVPLRAFALGVAVAVVAHQMSGAWLAAVVGPARPSMLVALLAGVAILFANHARGRFVWSALGVLVVWTALYQVAIDGLLPHWRALSPADAGHHALVLAALALLLTGTARLVRRHRAVWGRYQAPLHLNGLLAFLAALPVAWIALADPAASGPVLAGAMTLLVACSVPLLSPLPGASGWRGLLVPALLTGLAATVVPTTTLDDADTGRVAFTWGFALWLFAAALVGRWNRRFPDWAVSGSTWPWFGLAFVLAGFATLVVDPDTASGGLAGLALYLLLMLRYSAWVGFAWLGAASLTAAGLSLTGWWLAPVATGQWQPLTAGAMLASVIWLNAVLAAIPIWRRHGSALAGWLGWRERDLERPLLTSATIALLATLGLLVAFECAWVLGVSAMLGASVLHGGPAPGLALLAAVLALSFVHANYLAPRLAFAHAFLLSTLAVVVPVLMALAGAPHLPLAIALWGIVLLAVWRIRSRAGSAGDFAAAITSAISAWIGALPVISIALVVLMPWTPMAERLLVVSLVLGHAACIGWWQGQRGWLGGAALLALALEHAVWLLWLPAYDLYRALPWFALTGAANACLVSWLLARLDRAGERSAAAAGALRSVIAQALPIVVGLTVLELGAHAFAVTGSVAANLEVRWLSGVDAIAALAAYLVLVVLSVRTAHRHQGGRWIYAAALVAGAAGLYLRVVFIGLAPPGPLDTAVLIGAAYVLFALQRLTLSAPTMHVCLALPLLAVATLPTQLGSVHSGAALMAIAVLYLLIRGRTRNPVPLYLGVLALNASAYLWIPLWADRLGMFQLYVVPAAVSVLVLLHLHRRELRPGVLNGARLAALVTLYCGAAADVFAHPSLAMFGLAIGLSLASVILGIALRTRAFLYAGVAFLVINVGYQLVQLYPEQRLGRAILLIVLGMSITGGMIGFNIKREAILQRIRIFRADLDTWE